VSLYHGKRVRHAIKSCFSEKKYISFELEQRNLKEYTK
jgi:hypothetical protein